MDGRAVLEMLLEVMDGRNPSYKVTYSTLMHDIRAALAEPAAVPITPSMPAGIQPGDEVSVWGGRKPAAVPEGRPAIDEHYSRVPLVELRRLRAWEAWSREHAVPTLRMLDGIYGARDALAAAPRQEKP